MGVTADFPKSFMAVSEVTSSFQPCFLGSFFGGWMSFPVCRVIFPSSGSDKRLLSLGRAAVLSIRLIGRYFSILPPPDLKDLPPWKAKR